jgi:hypothetical protein
MQPLRLRWLGLTLVWWTEARKNSESDSNLSQPRERVGPHGAWLVKERARRVDPSSHFGKLLLLIYLANPYDPDKLRAFTPVNKNPGYFVVLKYCPDSNPQWSVQE